MMTLTPVPRQMATQDVTVTQTWPSIVFGLFVVLALPGGVLAWSALTEINGAVISRGTVGVETNVKTVQHLDGGIVTEISVRNGDHVAQGDVLIRLDDTASRAAFGVIAARLNELYAQRARLESEHLGHTEVAFPDDLAAVARKDARISALLRAQQSLFSVRQMRQNGEKSLLNQQIEQLGKLLGGLAAEHKAKNRQATLIDQEIESVRLLLSRGLYTQSRFLALEREAAQVEGQIGKLVGDIGRAQVAVTETQLKTVQIDKDYLQRVLTELRETQARITELEEQRVAAADRLARVVVRAPHSGYVHNLLVHTVGGVISAAQPIMEIIPDTDRLIVEARVPPNEMDQIREKQPATIRFAAFDQRTTPTIQGYVKNVSAAQLTDRITGAPYFSVIVEVDPHELQRLGPGKHLIPGMPAEAFIQTDARTALSYLVKPFSDALSQAFRER